MRPAKLISLVVLAGVLILFGTLPMVAEISTYSWPSTIATIERASSSDTFQNSKYFGYKILRNTTYEYSYSVNGVVFHGAATVSKALLPKDEMIPVKYNSANPAETKIDVGLNLYLLVVSVLVILGAIAIIWHLVAAIKRGRQNAGRQ